MSRKVSNYEQYQRDMEMEISLEDYLLIRKLAREGKSFETMTVKEMDENYGRDVRSLLYYDYELRRKKFWQRETGKRDPSLYDIGGSSLLTVVGVGSIDGLM